MYRVSRPTTAAVHRRCIYTVSYLWRQAIFIFTVTNCTLCEGPPKLALRGMSEPLKTLRWHPHNCFRKFCREFPSVSCVITLSYADRWTLVFLLWNLFGSSRPEQSQDHRARRKYINLFLSVCLSAPNEKLYRGIFRRLSPNSTKFDTHIYQTYALIEVFGGSDCLGMSKKQNW